MNVEVIIVDDCSTDDTVDLVRAINDPRVTLLCQNDRCGAPAARNRGLHVARGEFVQFLDADDVLSDTKIGACLREFEFAPRLTTAFCGAYIFGNVESNSSGPEYPPMKSGPLEYLLDRPFQTACGLHRRSAVLEVGGFRSDLKRAQEYDLHLRLAAAGAEMTYIPERLVGLRHHSSPHRITNTPATPEQMASIFEGVIETALSNNTIDVEGKRKLSQKAVLAAMACYRSGLSDAGKSCIESAYKCYPSVAYPHRNLVFRLVAGQSGIANVEYALMKLRHYMRRS